MIITRYARLFAYFVAFAFSRSFEFRFDFYIRILMDVIFYAVNIAFFRIIFLHTPSLGGWTEPQLMIFISGYCMVDAVNMTLFANNMWQFPTLVNRGDLDYYLVRPVSSLFFVSLRDFAANSFVNLLITFGIFGWAVSRYPEALHAAKLALFLGMLLNGVLIFYCLNLLFNLAVFYTHSGEGFGSLVWTLEKFGERPDRIYTGWLRRVVTLVLPFSLVASFPTRLLVDPFRWDILLQALAVSAALFSILLFTWNRALRAYSSASS
jgi:ABC-2 type transport system permease protein